MKQIFRLIMLLLLLSIARGAVYFIQPENRLIAKIYLEVFEIGYFKYQFSPENIAKTCAGSPEGQFYENCYTPKKKEFVAAHNLTVTGIVLEAALGVTILNHDKEIATKSGNQNLITRSEFLLLGQVIQSLRSVRTYKSTCGAEEKIRKEAEEKLVKTYAQLSTKVEEGISRMPAEASGTYKQLLVQYNAAIIPPQAAALAE